MSKDTQSRKWQLTINNPEEHGINSSSLTDILATVAHDYSCFCYERGHEGTLHIHLYICSKSPIRFSRIKKLFPSAHIEQAKGTHQENRDYVTKSGKWKNTDKEETNLSDTFQEFGEMPPERQLKEDKKERLYEMIASGMSNYEILQEDKSYLYQIKHIDEIRQTMIEAMYADTDRELEVVYMYGASGTGKTRSIHEMHGAKNICRITSYRQNGQVYFDSYECQDVLVFEEFHGQVPITEMLNYLDRYPLKLPARYQDKQACYTRVYLTSNKSLDEIYQYEQLHSPETYNALLRRINKVMTFNPDGTITTEYQTRKEIPNECANEKTSQSVA